MMIGPRDATPNEAEQADTAENPGVEPARSGSEDAELFAGDSMAEGDVESGTGAEPDAATANVGGVND